MFKKLISRFKEEKKIVDDATALFNDKGKNTKCSIGFIIFNILSFAIVFMILYPFFKQYIYVLKVFIPLVVVSGIAIYFILTYGSYFNFKLLVTAYQLDVDYKHTKTFFMFDLFTLVISLSLIAAGIIFKIFF